MNLRHIGHLARVLRTKISLRKQGRQMICRQVKLMKSAAFSSKQIGQHKELEVVVTIANILA